MTDAREPRITTAPFSRRLVVMVKEPHAGRVKTRLGRQVGAVAATAFYRQSALAVIRRLAASTLWETWLAVAPDPSAGSRFWPRHLPRRGQGGGDLGSRMQRIMDWPGRGPIVIVGTDIPAIQRNHVARAFKALGRADAVFGPTPDGGYWLVGLNRSLRIQRPFSGVRWSSEYAFADTAANLAGLDVAHVDELCDVDTAADWHAVRAWSGRVVVPART